MACAAVVVVATLFRRTFSVEASGARDTVNVSIPVRVPASICSSTERREPFSSRIPFHWVTSPMRVISAARAWNSRSMVLRSAALAVPLRAWTASSRMRISSDDTSPSAPSAICTIETPSVALRLAWSSERMRARRRSAIATPDASSAAVGMRRPEASRCRLRPTRSLVPARRFRISGTGRSAVRKLIVGRLLGARGAGRRHRETP